MCCLFQGLSDPNNYHEFCRLLARLKSNYQLGELVKVDSYPQVIKQIAEFTVTSLQVTFILQVPLVLYITIVLQITLILQVTHVLRIAGYLHTTGNPHTCTKGSPCTKGNPCTTGNLCTESCAAGKLSTTGNPHHDHYQLFVSDMSD